MKNTQGGVLDVRPEVEMLSTNAGMDGAAVGSGNRGPQQGRESGVDPSGQERAGLALHATVAGRQLAGSVSQIPP